MFNLAKPAFLSAALLAGAAAPAFAADFYEPPPVEIPPPPIEYGGWYLRGHVGMSNQRVDEIYNELFENAATVEFLDDGGFDSGPLFGVGVGYEVNHWLRGDLTAEYRGKTHFSALDRYDETGDGVWDGTNEYSAKKSEWLFLANAYADLGEWHGISPYVGAGIGASRNTIHNFRDVNVPNGGVAYGATDSEWNLAWALHAGLGIRATENLTVDLGYSFVNLGDAQSGDLVAYDGTNSVDNPMEFKDITSHDFKLGVRYAFN